MRPCLMMMQLFLHAEALNVVPEVSKVTTDGSLFPLKLAIKYILKDTFISAAFNPISEDILVSIQT